MNIFALPQCHKQQWGQNFLYCTAGAIFFPPAFSANFLTVLQAPTISTKDKDSEREKASNQEDGLSIRSPIRFWEHTIYKTPQEVLEGINLLSCVLNAEINITRGGNDKCWIKRCTGKVLRDFRGEKKFFFLFWLNSRHGLRRSRISITNQKGIPVIKDVEVCLRKAESICLGDFIGMRGRNGK